jgi:hypothetical protein
MPANSPPRSLAFVVATPLEEQFARVANPQQLRFTFPTQVFNPGEELNPVAWFPEENTAFSVDIR